MKCAFFCGTSLSGDEKYVWRGDKKKKKRKKKTKMNIEMDMKVAPFKVEKMRFYVMLLIFQFWYQIYLFAFEMWLRVTWGRFKLTSFTRDTESVFEEPDFIWNIQCAKRCDCFFMRSMRRYWSAHLLYKKPDNLQMLFPQLIHLSCELT